MAERPSVEINRTCLSLLFRDNAASPGDQEGFLIGEVVQRVQKISDTQENAGTLTVIRVTSTFPLPKHCKFYNGVGKIDIETFKSLLGPYEAKIVGYYDFKRNMSPELEEDVTFTQLNVLKQLILITDHSDQKPFVFMRLRQRHEGNGTILNAYTYFTLTESGNFVKLASSIPNLGDTSHDRYVQNAAVPLVDKLFTKMVAPKKDPETLPVVKIHHAMLEQLKAAAVESCDLEEQYKEMALLLNHGVTESQRAKLEQRGKGYECAPVKEEEEQPVPSTSKKSVRRSAPAKEEEPWTNVNTASRRRTGILKK